MRISLCRLRSGIKSALRAAPFTFEVYIHAFNPSVSKHFPDEDDHPSALPLAHMAKTHWQVKPQVKSDSFTQLFL
jgi:hypothetical protein